MIAATYYDGQTTHRHPVMVAVRGGILAIKGDGVQRAFRVSQLDISERLEHGPRIVRLPQSACIEIVDPAFSAALAANGYRDPWVVRWQQHWLLSLFALVFLLALIIAGYQWGLPWAADGIARHLPASIERKIGDEQLRMIDAAYLRPSRLPAAEQARLTHLFSQLKQPHGEHTVYRLEFRQSGMGPNAFALPNGVIVLTDQLVTLTRSDAAVLAVLGHELGHVHRRHSLRRLMQALSVGAVVNLFIGDVSTVLATVPAFLLDQKYSRDFEREADRYAIDMMRANGIALSPMADLLESMRSAKAQGRARRKQASDYFSSHPSDDERIEALRAADRAN
jgi:Zn-dependent protease with chaperone function